MKSAANEALTNKLRELEQRNAATLSSTVAAERNAGLSAARARIDQECEAESRRLRVALAEVDGTRMGAHARLEEATEKTHRARARELLARVFATGATELSAMIHAFRLEPSRSVATAVRERWDTFNQTAMAELGEPLGTHVLAAVLVDDVVAEPGRAGAVNALSDQQYGCVDAVLTALNAFVSVSASARGDLQIYLERVDTLISAVAARHAGVAADPMQAGLHALRRENATARDLTAARSEFVARHERARQAEFAATYRAPPSLREFLTERLERLGVG